MAIFTVKTATASDETAVIDIIVLAMSLDPVMRWLYPDPHNYLLHFPGFVRVFGGKAFEHSSAYYTDGYTGAELWLPPGVCQDAEAVMSVLKRTVIEPDQEAVMAILDQMDRFHPQEPHWYLSMIGLIIFIFFKG